MVNYHSEDYKGRESESDILFLSYHIFWRDFCVRSRHCGRVAGSQVGHYLWPLYPIPSAHHKGIVLSWKYSPVANSAISAIRRTLRPNPGVATHFPFTNTSFPRIVTVWIRPRTCRPANGVHPAILQPPASGIFQCSSVFTLGKARIVWFQKFTEKIYQFFWFTVKSMKYR